MPDSAGLIEYYKLAAAVLPVLWIGNVLQQLDPNAARAAANDSKLDANAWKRRPSGPSAPRGRKSHRLPEPQRPRCPDQNGAART